MSLTINNRNYLLIFFLGVALCTLACGKQRVTSLNTTIDSYWRSVRWNAPGNLAGYVEENGRQAFMEEISKKLDNIRVVDFNVVNVTMAKSKKSALAQVRYTYYFVDTQNLVADQELQRWNYESGRGWQLQVNEAGQVKPQKPAPKTKR